MYTIPHPGVRSMQDICRSARVADCGHCWARSGQACLVPGPASGPPAPVVSTETGAGGYHLARFARARRRGLITAAEMAAVLQGYDVFAGHTVIWDADEGRCPGGGAVNAVVGAWRPSGGAS